jgi:CarD family transcriptional regulator
MQFAVGDKVVHPRYGPGRITGFTSREVPDGATRYYVIEIPGQGLTVHMPVLKASEVGMRLAMSECRLRRVLSMLRGRPNLLPGDFHERQEQMWAKLKTGGVVQLASVVRDLTWHRKCAHLTKKDSDYLRQGLGLLAAEMALVSGGALSDASKLIEATLAVGMATALN